MYMYTINRFSQPLTFVCCMVFVVQMAEANFYQFLLELAVFLYCVKKKKSFYITLIFSRWKASYPKISFENCHTAD